jgi:undecaprenyl-diphosphatase
VNYWQAVFLGILQGLTEFLPVSSSGHLAIAQGLWNVTGGDLLFEVTVHLATLIAVVAYYRRDIAGIARSAVTRQGALWQTMTGRRWIILILMASIPAAAVGLGLKQQIEGSFADLGGVGLRLVATGALLFSTAPLAASRMRLGSGAAWIIGAAQAVAILPGISRSGATIATAIWMGIDREQAARFSFLLGAFLLESIDAWQAGVSLSTGDVGPLILGFVAALVSGYFAVTVLIRTLVRRRFALFGIWCWIVGLPAWWWWSA